MLIVGLSIDQRTELLKVLLGLVQHSLEGAGVLILVVAPMPLIGDGEDAEGIGDAVCNVSE